SVHQIENAVYLYLVKNRKHKNQGRLWIVNKEEKVWAIMTLTLAEINNILHQQFKAICIRSKLLIKKGKTFSTTSWLGSDFELLSEIASSVHKDNLRVSMFIFERTYYDAIDEGDCFEHIETNE
ncbi:MAG TPA: hypothetical protein VJK72_04670, partial [Candidatus Nanoarchaeia archaeon]|nr:hypothetical protein [Candidatus Nanoarchaeia archaeon]